MYIVDNPPHYPAIFLHMIHTLQEFLDHRLVILWNFLRRNSVNLNFVIYTSQR